MAYIDPRTVCAPKAFVRSVEVLYNYNRPNNGWSVARIDWDGTDTIGIRWNGDENAGIGNPQSRGNATWFIVPEPLRQTILQKIEELSHSGPGGLLEKYAEMAKDGAREREAEEWSEGLIGDVSAPR